MVFPKTFFSERNPFIWQQSAACHCYIVLRVTEYFAIP